MRNRLGKKRDDIEKVQQIVWENCQECTSEVTAVKEHLISEINKITGNLLHDLREQKNKVYLGIDKSFANIDEKLDLLEDFEMIAKNKTVFEVETSKLERFRCVRDELEFRFSKTNSLQYSDLCEVW